MRTLVITGGNGGLGTEVVRRLSLDYNCIVPTREQLDLTNEESVRRAFETFGEIYGLVHLVGGWTGGSVRETSLETWSTMLATNTTTAFLAAREALAHMTHPGRIVVVSSLVTLHPVGGSAAYTVAKSALNALAQVLASEERKNGITANAVLPDSMATPAMLKEMDASKLVPLERVSATIAFLLSDEAAGTSGTLVPIRA
ncbi:MAG TPA: SDR family oxidoreductase [Thermoanaerobaculia bacterium]|jgi:NAD(P)-dependent dehydrogenase (short-subunit alcohol dehydrogenase family)|nr:SDR family oxidoreductase [Thermoanaerobaculia bacterium]